MPWPRVRLQWTAADPSRQPGHFISHYVGHEGPGSILEQLKKLGWATSLSSSASNGAAGFEFFRININLSATGLGASLIARAEGKRPADHLHARRAVNYQAVLRVVFDYLTLLRSTPPQAWAAAEMKKLGEIGWRWKENGQPAPLVKGLASRLTEGTYPPGKVLVGPWFADEFDEARVVECLEGLVSERCRVFVGSKEPLEGREGWSEREEYYGTEYEIRLLQVDLKEVSGFSV